MHVITLSAAYGAGGGLIGRAAAERLGVPFLDRAIPAKVASDLGVTLEDALARDERVKGWLHRLLTAAAPMSSDYMVGATPPRVALLPDTEYVTCTRGAIHDTVREHGGVILGRAAAMVLRDHPTALHVRLDGDPERRIRQAMRTLHIGEHEARNAQVQNDNARTSYVRHFYRADATDPAHYHLLLDSTRLSFDTCVELIVTAASEERPSLG
ncbi:MAG TPA: cytidylate kinase-like family protein [Pseudonocardia sp.]|jgi:cytidylate kinase|uniref:cytidylate kinase-like family protein n=1 Tax=Pseudonocardia sp. TaxID=60912 RepID=UPI002F3EC6E0